MQAQKVSVRVVEQEDHTYEVDLTELSKFEICWLRGALIALIIRREGWKGAIAILRDVAECLEMEGLLPDKAPQ